MTDSVSSPATTAKLPVASSRRIRPGVAPLGQLPPPVLLLAVELLSNVLPSEAQIADLADVVRDQAAALFPGAESIALEPLPGLGIVRVRIGVFSREPNAAELPAAEDALRGLALSTSGVPLRNLAIFVSLGVLDGAADQQLPALQEMFRKGGLELSNIDVRFDAGKDDIVTDLFLTRDGIFDGPWVATLTDRPVRVDISGFDIGGQPRHRFLCDPATVEVRGRAGRRRIENKLKELEPTGVLCELLRRVQIATILLGPDPGDPADPNDDQPAQAAEISYFVVDRSADGVRLSGGLVLRLRVPEIRSIEPTRALALDTTPSLSRRLRADLLDLRAPLTFQWTLSQGGTLLNPQTASPTLVFNLAGSDAGEVFEKEVRVQVSDADGFVRELTRTVSVEIISEDDFPDEFPDGKPEPILPFAAARNEGQAGIP
jgi:hypothetical protein